MRRMMMQSKFRLDAQKIWIPLLYSLDQRYDVANSQWVAKETISVGPNAKIYGLGWTGEKGATYANELDIGRHDRQPDSFGCNTDITSPAIRMISFTPSCATLYIATSEASMYYRTRDSENDSWSGNKKIKTGADAWSNESITLEDGTVKSLLTYYPDYTASIFRVRAGAHAQNWFIKIDADEKRKPTRQYCNT